MSRRGQKGGGPGPSSSSSQAANHDTGGDNILQESNPDATDPVIANIRFGMESILKIFQETVPFCPDEDEQWQITAKLEANLLQLVESELVYAQTSSIVNQVVDELALQDNREMDAKQFADSVDSINELANLRLQQYKATLTTDILKGHPKFLQMQHQMEEIKSDGKGGGGGGGAGVDNADAETEAEEVDLDDSMMGDEEDDEEEHEVIPDIDPISKQALKDPVRNKLCRHIYGKAAITQLLKSNQKTRCPYMGCDNNQFVKIAHLVDDPFLTAKVTGQPPPPKVATRGKPTSRGKARRGRRRH